MGEDFPHDRRQGRTRQRALPHPAAARSIRCRGEYRILSSLGAIDRQFQMEMREGVRDEARHALPARTQRRVLLDGMVRRGLRPWGRRCLQHPTEKSARRPLPQQHGAVLPDRDEGRAPARGPLGLRRLVGELFSETRGKPATEGTERAEAAGRTARGADRRAKVHQALREIAGMLGRGQPLRQRLDLRLRRRQRRLDCEQPRDYPFDIAVHRGRMPPEGDRGDRGRRIGPDAGKLAQGVLGAGKTAAMGLRHGARAGMEIAGTGVIAEPGPGGEHVTEAGPRQCRHIRPAAQKVDIARRHRLHGGLLEHDLAEPDLVGILQMSRRRPPRQRSPLAPVPSQQRAGDPPVRTGQVRASGVYVLHNSPCHARSRGAMV